MENFSRRIVSNDRVNTNFSEHNSFRAEIFSHLEDVERKFVVYKINGKNYIGVHNQESFSIVFKGEERTRAKIGISGIDLLNNQTFDDTWKNKNLVDASKIQQIKVWPDKTFSGESLSLVFSSQTNSVSGQLGLNSESKMEIAWYELVQTARVLSFPKQGRGVYDPQPGVKELNAYIDNVSREGSGGKAGIGFGEEVYQTVREVNGEYEPELVHISSVKILWWNELQQLLQQTQYPAMQQNFGQQSIGLPLGGLKPASGDRYQRLV